MSDGTIDKKLSHQKRWCDWWILKLTNYNVLNEVEFEVTFIVINKIYIVSSRVLRILVLR